MGVSWVLGMGANLGVLGPPYFSASLLFLECVTDTLAHYLMHSAHSVCMCEQSWITYSYINMM